jgi:hypothetical protein
MPEPLVAIRQYLTPEMAQKDLKALASADIPAYLKNTHSEYGCELTVPGSLRDRALELLAPESPQLLNLEGTTRSCPNCRTGLNRTVNRTAFIALPLAIVTAVWVAFKGEPVNGVLIFATTAAIVAVLSERRAAWHCTSCGAQFSEGQLDARRDADD